VCFADGGMLSSDLVYVSLNDREKPAVVPTEARGGPAFFGALAERGYFPEHVWRRAVGDTSGGLHCWPPADHWAAGLSLALRSDLLDESEIDPPVWVLRTRRASDKPVLHLRHLTGEDAFRQLG
jgi:hypothetical protein